VAPNYRVPGPTGNNISAPDNSPSLEFWIEERLGIGGLCTGIISVLESGGSIALAGIGTTAGSLLLPIGAFFLGKDIAEEDDRESSMVTDFGQRLIGSAIIDAVNEIRSRTRWKSFFEARRLNKKGHFDQLVQQWRSRMISQFLAQWFASDHFYSNRNHCCPRQDRVVPRPAESKDLGRGENGISDGGLLLSLGAACPNHISPRESCRDSGSMGGVPNGLSSHAVKSR
jgi:hypothetical protein